jgi:hypothetical protein
MSRLNRSATGPAKEGNASTQTLSNSPSKEGMAAPAIKVRDILINVGC